MLYINSFDLRMHDESCQALPLDMAHRLGTFKKIPADLLGNPPEANCNGICIPVKQTADKFCCSYLVSVRLILTAFALVQVLETRLPARPFQEPKSARILIPTILPGED
jgi:hypothetical protein